MSARFTVTPDSRPAFERYARLHEDGARGRHVILGPERVYELDAIGVAVLKLCDGRRSLAEIGAELARTYAAPVEIIQRDVAILLQGLADKGVLRDGQPPHAGPARTVPAYAQNPGGPTGLLAELTHRCPLQCPYCSNPLDLERANAEIGAQDWAGTFRQAAALGVLQLHLSGGEPTARTDFADILKGAVEAGLYTNLITAGVLLDEARFDALAALGLDHVQLSVQDAVPGNADKISGYKNGFAKKRQVAEWARARGMALTINAPIHRANIAHLHGIIEFAAEAGAQRIEIAHIQFYAWAERNRAALLPTREQFEETVAIVERAREEYSGRLAFDFVAHDHYSSFPKACMGGWGRSIIVVTPSGRALPCHAAQTLPGLTFENVRDRPLADIWRQGAAFQAYRGEAWMQAPCRTCERRTQDFGGCRCQAYAVTGDAAATDPTCKFSGAHGAFAAVAEAEAHAPAPAFVYRRMGASA